MAVLFRVLRSNFSIQIGNFIESKRLAGNKYNTEAIVLAAFDEFVANSFPDETELTKEVVLKWVEKDSNETESNRKRRVVVIRQFAKYLTIHGEKAWVIPRGIHPYPKRYVPYIFSIDELARFFEALDTMSFNKQSPLRHLMYPVFFRILLCCGMRYSEVVNLKMKNINLTEKFIKIDNSKSGKSRIIPLNDYLNKHLVQYISRCCTTRGSESYVFSYCNGIKCLTPYAPHAIFRDMLSLAGIQYKGPGVGPRIHDLRHTAVVLRIKSWLEERKELSSCLPYLWHYLGHKSYQELSYYFHLVSELWPDLMNKTELAYPNIIPKITNEEAQYDK